MSTQRLLAFEYIIAIGMVSWAAIKGDGKTRFWPWPPTIMLTSVAFAMIGLLAISQPKLAGVVGGGFLSAQVIRALQAKDIFGISGIPKSKVFAYYGEKDVNTTGKSGDTYKRVLTF